ncbi:hypothetical protein ACFQ6U_35895 [Streptomyces sp. NPDC056465]|uniref:hypothetical protein n=1 Tax=Streptomyces sp. NPDC056465 TaxID=3345829 RepID=UPI00369B558B
MAPFENVALDELDDEQRRWLPDPAPAELRLVRCTACGSIRGTNPWGLDPWKNHEDECDGLDQDDDEDN